MRQSLWQRVHPKVNPDKFHSILAARDSGCSGTRLGFDALAIARGAPPARGVIQKVGLPLKEQVLDLSMMAALVFPTHCLL